MGSDRDDSWLDAPPSDPAEVRARYDAWAEEYDTDLAGWGYRAPGRIAAMLAEWADRAAPVLDAGCGTGMGGRALRAAGFTGRLVGIDVSEPSLAVAGRAGAYDELLVASLDEPLPFDDGAFGAVACIGVLTYVPDVESCWRELARVSVPGGIVAFTQRADVWDERNCAAVLDRLADDGVWEPVVVSEPELYVPGSSDLADVPARYVAARIGVPAA